MEGNPLVGLSMNFDLWLCQVAVVRMHFVHAYCACTRACYTAYRMLICCGCMLACCVYMCHVSMLCLDYDIWNIVYVWRHIVHACWHVVDKHWHVVHACWHIVHERWHGLFNECYRHVRNLVHVKFDRSPPPPYDRCQTLHFSATIWKGSGYETTSYPGSSPAEKREFLQEKCLLVLWPACACLPARNSLVNEVEILGLIYYPKRSCTEVMKGPCFRNRSVSSRSPILLRGSP